MVIHHIIIAVLVIALVCSSANRIHPTIHCRQLPQLERKGDYMYRYYKPALFIIAAILLLAAGCANRNPQGEPVVRVHSSASGGVETLSYTMHVKLVDSVNGQSAETPPLKVAFRFDGGNVIARVDMPTSYFPDGKARILLMDQTNRRSAVLLRHGLQPDPQLDSESLAEALFGNSYELGLFDPDRPFRRLSAADFSKRMRGLSFDVVQSNQHRLVATRAFTDAQGEERKFTLIFDDAVGAVV